MQSNNAIIPGSLGAIARQSNQSIAETFVNADTIAIVDTSGSMNSHDSRGGKSRYDVACEELAQLQERLPGKIAVIAFSSNPIFCPDGKPSYLGGGTNLTQALEFARIADVPGMTFFVISDGYPDDPEGALKLAAQYKNKIHTIYVGPESESRGRDFLEQLARIAGGKSTLADRAQELTAKIIQLLPG